MKKKDTKVQVRILLRNLNDVVALSGRFYAKLSLYSKFKKSIGVSSKQNLVQSTVTWNEIFQFKTKITTKSDGTNKPLIFRISIYKELKDGHEVDKVGFIEINLLEFWQPDDPTGCDDYGFRNATIILDGKESRHRRLDNSMLKIAVSVESIEKETKKEKIILEFLPEQKGGLTVNNVFQLGTNRHDSLDTRRNDSLMSDCISISSYRKYPISVEGSYSSDGGNCDIFKFDDDKNSVNSINGTNLMTHQTGNSVGGGGVTVNQVNCDAILSHGGQQMNHYNHHGFLEVGTSRSEIGDSNMTVTGLNISGYSHRTKTQGSVSTSSTDLQSMTNMPHGGVVSSHRTTINGTATTDKKIMENNNIISDRNEYIEKKLIDCCGDDAISSIRETRLETDRMVGLIISYKKRIRMQSNG